ncbi:hypothetical protein [Halochromatium glycolicum]|uniref:PIN domain-containing protein n=1 Tax=Halochromatium glycolicum TaxID=85075 RepID=A0AAJ0U4J5_9GAMM|nr:hypothetical protein [Halochromatium glycolicum]MBK1705161.1 hypothetical protein [Halochromatium glycolicum]
MQARCFPLPVQARAGLPGPLITNLAVITEVVYVLDFAAQAQRDFLLWAESALVLETETVSDLPADFADASLVALCERRRITRVASVDSDFTVYRMQDRRGFSNLFHAPG